MHPTDTKHQFITLRARGLALGKISEQLDVPKSTLGRWQADHEDEIQQLQRVEWEEIEAQYGYSLQDDLRRIMKRMRAAEDQLDARSLERFTRRELMQLIREGRREYEKKRALLLGTPKRDKMVRPPTPPQSEITNPKAEISLEGGAPRRQESEVRENSACTNHEPRVQPSSPSHSPTFTPAHLQAASTSESSHPVETAESEIPNLPSEADTGENSVAGKFISALHRLQAAEADSSECQNAPPTESEIQNPSSEIDSAAPLPLPRGEGTGEGQTGNSVSLPRAAQTKSLAEPVRDLNPQPTTFNQTENPAKTRPFPSQNSGVHNSALSDDKSKTEIPNSKINEPCDAEGDFGGESVPVSSFESTREWLERQGIQVSRIPKGARIITAG